MALIINYRFFFFLFIRAGKPKREWETLIGNSDVYPSMSPSMSTRMSINVNIAIKVFRRKNTFSEFSTTSVSSVCK